MLCCVQNLKSFLNVEHSSYGPELPTVVKVPYEFSRGKGLLIHGLMGDTSEYFQNPFVKFYDNGKQLALEIFLDPNFNAIKAWSPFNEVQILYFKPVSLFSTDFLLDLRTSIPTSWQMLITR